MKRMLLPQGEPHSSIAPMHHSEVKLEEEVIDIDASAIYVSLSGDGMISLATFHKAM